MPASYKPLAGLSTVLCWTLKVLLVLQVLSMADEVWTHYSAKQSMAKLRALQQELKAFEEREENAPDEIPDRETDLDVDTNGDVQTEADLPVSDAEGRAVPATNRSSAWISFEPSPDDAGAEASMEIVDDEPEFEDSLPPRDIDEPGLAEDAAGKMIGSDDVDEPRFALGWRDWFDIISVMALPLGLIVVYLVSGILFLMWVYRANRNLRAFSGRPMTYSSAWAVLSYFIPWVNLFVPPAVMGEIWAVSHRSNKGSLVPLWWLLVVLNWLASEAFMRTFRRSARSMDALFSDNLLLLSLAGDVFSILVTAVTFMLVSRVAAAYRENIVESPDLETGTA